MSRVNLQERNQNHRRVVVTKVEPFQAVDLNSPNRIPFPNLNAKNVHEAIEATIDPFEALDMMPDGALEPCTPFPGRDGIPFDAEILYARRAAESQTHPELSRLEVKFGFKIVGYFYRTRRGSVALSCLKDGFQSTMQTGISFEAFLTLPNLREPSRVEPIPDTSQYAVTDDPQKPGWIVDPDKETCGCQLIFKHDFECRHLKAVYKYQAENAVSFHKKTPADFPKAENTPETPVVESKKEIEDKPIDAGGEVPSPTPIDVNIRGEGLGGGVKQDTPSGNSSPLKPPSHWMSDLVAKHHPTSLAALETNGVQEAVYCAICSRKLTNPESRRTQLGPVCREKVGQRGEAHLRENVVSEKLLCATRIYKDAKFQNWILQGCLQLDAPVPKTVLKQKKTEYWGLKRAPSLYYLCKNLKLHCIHKVGKEVKYQRITATSRENELHQMAWREAKDEYIDNGGKKVMTILL